MFILVYGKVGYSEILFPGLKVIQIKELSGKIRAKVVKSFLYIAFM